MSRLPDLLATLRASTPAMVADTTALCQVESPSDDLAATTTCADLAAEIGTRLVGRPPQRLTEQGRVSLLWPAAPGGLLLLGHLDTVWPVGTLARWPMTVVDGRLSGPGVFDMKAGVVQGLYALATLRAFGAPAAAGMLLTTDEEIGSPSSRALIERVAADHRGVLVLEASAAGALKTGRKGVSLYRVELHGRAAHAGLEPERGVNALVELAHQVTAMTALAALAGLAMLNTTIRRMSRRTRSQPAVAPPFFASDRDRRADRWQPRPRNPPP